MPVAVEGILGYRNWSYYSWFSVGALYEHHMPISAVDGLAWYVMEGLNISFLVFDKDYYLNSSDLLLFSFGLMGALGLDYKFLQHPFKYQRWLVTNICYWRWILDWIWREAMEAWGVRYTFR